MTKKQIAVLVGIVLVGCEKPEEAQKVAPTVIFPPERMAQWKGNVGVPGGIPNRTTIFKTLTPSGGDDAAQIQTAVLTCPADQVVMLAAGTFRLVTSVAWNNKNNVTLRGAGQGRTILKTEGGIIHVRGIEPWPPPTDWQPITAGATKGSNTITIADTTAYAVDMIFDICPQKMPIWTKNIGGKPDTEQNLKGQFKVRSKTATTITFDPPLPMDFTSNGNLKLPMPPPGAIASKAATVMFSGIESLTFDLNKQSSVSWAFWYSSCWGCWLKDVEIVNAYTRLSFYEACVRCEVRQCYMHDTIAQGPNHEGLDWGHSSWNLVEDNGFANAGAMAIIFGDGANKGMCNAISYNYVVNVPGWWDISINHGPHGMLNLIEGNNIHWYKDDGYFGSSSHTTLLRNRIDWQIALKHFSTFYTIVGNVLGTAGNNTVYESSKPGIYESSIYEFGYPNIGNVSYVGTFGPTNPPDYSGLPNTLDGTQQRDMNVGNTVVRHGNWDSVNNAVIWDANIADRNIPSSLLYDSTPAWWPTGLRWPPIGADLQPMTGKIPAQIRYENLGKPPSPSPSVSPTPTVAPTVVPTASPAPTTTVTATPNVTPSPVPSPSPTVTATAAPSPTVTSTPPPSATETPAVIILQPGHTILITVPTPSP
jgi:hypothetical protein